MNVYDRKLYALLQGLNIPREQAPTVLSAQWETLEAWWQTAGSAITQIASASDRMALAAAVPPISLEATETRHLLSAQPYPLSATELPLTLPDLSASDSQTTFSKVWRFLPDILTQQNPEALLQPAHPLLPDCPRHSYSNTLSAIAGAMYPNTWQPGQPPERPYLLLFTFSPVQEFIKSSRKLLDFWSGSYLLHYLSAYLCWQIAEQYGPDSIITPSLWGQDIVDAFLLQQKTDLQQDFNHYGKGDPCERFAIKQSSSLSTAGFPNVITALIPGKQAVAELGESLRQILNDRWVEMGTQIRAEIKAQVSATLITPEGQQSLWNCIRTEFPDATDPNPYLEELVQWQHGGRWEWNKLWDAQLSNTWESYWVAVPLGDPDESTQSQSPISPNWVNAQQTLAQSPTLPTPLEQQLYEALNVGLNVGLFWGSFQARLGKAIQAIKNTRTWQLPAAPGERSTLSGQFSALHPNLLYAQHRQSDFREGRGLTAGSMRLFWRVMAEVYPGLFNGSEKLNAIELTKRMAWVYGGVATSLGLDANRLDDALTPATDSMTDNMADPMNGNDTGEITAPLDPEQWIRFPNLSSIACARFAYEAPDRMQHYWSTLAGLLEPSFSNQQRKAFHRATRRPLCLPKSDRVQRHRYNGVMFSSKWLAEDIGLQREDGNRLRSLVAEAHQRCGFGDGSPADWWVLVLADGDGMGRYVTGKKLKPYRDYLAAQATPYLTQPESPWQELLTLQKRMGPATHVGLNRALLDFSNGLVPYLTEQRYCGKVIYSGGDDVMAALPLEDLPEFLLSLRAAWQGAPDPGGDFRAEGGYWIPQHPLPGLAERPYFTMGSGATMSMGIAIAHKSVPLPTVLEHIWQAEKERAKKISGKDGLCFRVIYQSGNTLEALLKGSLLESWWQIVQQPSADLSPLLYRLAEDLPQRACVTPSHQLFAKAAAVIMAGRDERKHLSNFSHLETWLNQWEDWVNSLPHQDQPLLGTQPEDMGNLLRFSAFWVDKMTQRQAWLNRTAEGVR